MPALLPPELDPLLEAHLGAVARVRRNARLHRLSARRWIVVVLATVALLGVRWVSGVSLFWAFPLLAAAMVLTVLWSWRESRRAPVDLDEAARALEARHPELQLALQTAIEQRAEGGKFSFLQRRVIRRALQHAEQHDWDQPDRALSRWKTVHVTAICVAFALLAIVVISEKRSPGRRVRFPLSATLGVTVTPGNAEFERRSIVVVTARFGGALPKNVRLLWQPTDGESHAQVMAKSLSDPIFAFSLPPLLKDTTYQISYDGRTTASFKLSAFDFPALVRGDAALTFPEYTGLAPRTIAETRRVSAVEGTELSYTFAMNKPLRRATLRDADGSEIELTAANAERSRFATSFRIEKSRRFTLRLEDMQGRANRVPEEIRIEAIVNQRPQIHWIAPAGDPRVSPIEEVRLQADARDDFGLLDYGVAFSFGNAEPEFVSLKAGPDHPIEAKFDHRLSLESRKVEPGQLVTWFAWADDFGPDGKSRRTTGDLHFAEVRPLDEIFREDDSGGGSQSSQQGAGQQNQELIELQREISIALWKLKQSEPTAEKRKENLDTLEQSQRHVRDRLQESLAELRDPRQRASAEKAKSMMDRTLEHLAEATKDRTPTPLNGAWTNAQGAYQELLKMQPKETRVGQANARNGRSGGQRGNQRQLNQLEFKQAENRYETESEAQSLTTPEQREQLQALSKLRELARRQQEVNQRLQELQTALTAAADDAQREQVQRELKRLEEEQRRLLADTDDLRSRMDRLPPGTQTQQAREQLDRTREDMRRSGERLERGEISPALAEGSRAAEGLESVKENFRRESSSQFSDQLREARREAREIGEKEKAAEKKLNELAQGTAPTLDDAQPREEIARTLEEQRAAREKLLETLRKVAEESETSEPGLHRRLYDLLRQQGQAQTSEQLQAGAEMLRRGFVPQAQQAITPAGRELQQLQNGVERAAESVLGDEAAELRYAQQELDDLSKQLQSERPVSEKAGQPGEKNAPGLAGVADPGNGENGASPSNPPGKENNAQRNGVAQPGKDSPGVAGVADPGAGEHGTSPEDQGHKSQTPGSATPATPGDKSNPGSATSSTAAAGAGEGGAPGSAGDPRSPAAGGNSGPRSVSDRPAGQRGGQLSPDRNGGGQRSGGGGGMESLMQELSQSSGSEEGRRPLTGEGFNDWFERLRTVEELTQLPEARQRLAGAREQAEALRREFKRHSVEPRWGLVESGIAAPLAEARVMLRQELARRENPQALQPVDRDPVPEIYAESVRKYYEALGR